ncbi:hypothetical protein TrLO_g4902 [Triparma laevis f. longispina]|uniref:Cyclic nucleotide-binding domain-containing protein n=1 Tax=Triparma laevis f. longispina TaxID=1714387 RepID=A0A9W7FL35_9STRA|nr:hypothetical protein TrLO_g4902 [Triparma laevis f. longispina]
MQRTATLRLNKDEELKIQMQSRIEAARLARAQSPSSKNTAPLKALTNFYQKVGFGSTHHRDKKKHTADVQEQIEKYVENLCQIYSKGTGGRADSLVEDRFVIYPDSSFRVYWDFTMLLLIVWSGFYVPFNLSFGSISGSTSFLDVFGLLVDVAFIVDVVLNFFTAFKEGAIVITEKQSIVEHYLKRWFFIDLVASVPLDRMFSGEAGATNKLLRLMRVFKLFRLARLFRYSNTLREVLQIQPSVIRLVQQMFGVFWVWHVFACGYWAIGQDGMTDEDDGWSPVDVTGTEEDTPEYHYIQSYLWAVETTFSFKVPGRAVRTDQALFSILTIILGIAMSALVIGTAASALASMDAEAIHKRRNLDKVVRYMKKRKLPSYFQRIIVDFHEYMAEKPSQDELMVGLPEPIKLRLSLLLNRDLVKDIPMLKQLPIGPIIGLMQKLSSEIYLPGEFAITAGDVGGTMHFVRSGELDLLLDDNQTIVQSLNEGDLFGHIAVIEHAPHSHSVRAVKYSEVTSLTATAYFSIVKESDKFEELITLEAIRQENLIAAAKKNVERYPKLGKMQGGEASTEHNDKRRPSISPMILPQTSKEIGEFAKALERQASRQGVRNSVLVKLVSGAERSFREISFAKIDETERKKHDKERSVRQERSVNRNFSSESNFSSSAKIYAVSEGAGGEEGADSSVKSETTSGQNMPAPPTPTNTPKKNT